MPRLSYKTDPDKILVQLGTAIRDKRKSCGVSQEELAHISGVDRVHMSRIERGESNLSILKIMQIAAALNCTAAEIMIEAGL